jgi:hypothetical protein
VKEKTVLSGEMKPPNGVQRTGLQLKRCFTDNGEEWLPLKVGYAANMMHGKRTKKLQEMATESI